MKQWFGILVLLGGCSSTTSDMRGSIDAAAPDVGARITRRDAATGPDEAEETGDAAVTDAVDCASETAPCTPVDDGCTAAEICSNGLDDDCNGVVDDGCSCATAAVQRCFLGPPGRRGVGACSDGAQVCVGDESGGHWSACTGGAMPTPETCDGADDDCNGCVDDGLCCVPTAPVCPGPDDPRIPVGTPYGVYFLRGSDLIAGTFRRWRWHVEGGPCDQLLWDTTGHVSYELSGDRRTLEDVTGELLHFTPSLSGDYAVTLEADAADGTSVTCSFVIHVRAPGLRVELCWDRQGDTNLDLWLHDPRNEGDWADPTDDATCAWYDCRNVRPTTGVAIDWGYAPTSGGACREPDANGACNNPRLDEDNRTTRGLSENIEVDAPRDGETFRVAVNYFGGTGAVHPMVNVFCSGVLRVTLGGATVGAVTYGLGPIEGMDTSGRDDTGSLWRVADVTFHEAQGDCDVSPVTTPAGEPCVSSTGDRSYGETCAAAAGL